MDPKIITFLLLGIGLPLVVESIHDEKAHVEGQKDNEFGGIEVVSGPMDSRKGTCK